MVVFFKGVVAVGARAQGRDLGNTRTTRAWTAQSLQLLLSLVPLSPSVWNSRAVNIQRDKCVKNR